MSRVPKVVKVGHQADHLQKPAACEKAEDDSVALMILRPLDFRVYEYSNETAGVCDGELKSACRGPLVVASRVLHDQVSDRQVRAYRGFEKSSKSSRSLLTLESHPRTGGTLLYRPVDMRNVMPYLTLV